MAEDYVENGLEFLGHATGKHFDSLYDKVIGKPKPLPQKDEKSKENDNYDGPFREKRSRRNSESYATYERGGVRSSSQENYVFTRTGTQIGKHRNTLPSPEPAPEFDIGRGNLLTERSLRKQEQLLPPKKNLLLEKGLPPKEDLLLVYKSKSKPRRDSAMASGYRDDYRESGYRGDNDRPRSQPPRGRYYDDEDSDYDERSGDRHRGGGRGWDDRDDYDTVKETREVYRGPAANRPWGPERNESGRSDYSRDGPYGSGAVAQYGRRSDGNLDRPASTYLSRREKSRGRDSYRSRSRSYSRSSSRSRSRSASGIRGKLEDTFSTSKQGIAAGLAGAVIGGLAGREIGKGQHRNRDAVIGAVVGGLAANAGEHKWREYKNNKERDRDLERYERPYDGRSRSNMR